MNRPAGDWRLRRAACVLAIMDTITAQREAERNGAPILWDTQVIDAHEATCEHCRPCDRDHATGAVR